MKLSVEENIRLSQHTTLKTGGPANYFVEVTSEEELADALSLEFGSLSPLVLGGGSNLFIGDAGYAGLVIKNSLKGIDYHDEEGVTFMTCGSGEDFDEIVADSVAKGYWGLENLSHIPGTVGATPIQNVGAYGVEVSSLVQEVEAINMKDSSKKIFSNHACDFSYRNSFFKTPTGKEWFITKVVFVLSKTPKPVLEYGSLTELKQKQNITPQQIRDEVVNIRAGKFPDWHKVGTAGSFFKNPIIEKTLFEEIKKRYPELVSYQVDEARVKVPLGMILDKICNLKGYCSNGVCLYKNQALVLINESAVSSQVIDEFAQELEQQVKNKTGITIEREVSCV